MIERNIIVIGASLGGVEALLRIVEDLPADLNAAVFIVLHIGSASSRLTEILSHRSRLPVDQPFDREEIVAGRIYVAPPDLHMMLEQGRIRLVRGPKENFTRPAVDPLFRSAAIEFGTRVVGVVLTGWMDDGPAGLRAIKDRGGIAIVQDPAEAMAPSMPRNAAASVTADHICSVKEMAPLLVGYDPAGLSAPAVPRHLEVEHKLTAMEIYMAEEQELELLGSPSGLTCPECHGVLYRIHDDRLLRFRCRAGHAMSARALLARLSAERESVIWSAIRSLTEEATLIWQFSKGKGALRPDLRPQVAVDADVLLEFAGRLRTILTEWPSPSDSSP